MRSALYPIVLGGSLQTRVIRWARARGAFLPIPAIASTMTVGTDGSGGAPAADGVVGRIYCATGSGRYAAAPSDAARGILRQSGNLSYLDTDGVDDWMQIFPTLNLGEQWWHVGGWTMEATGGSAFCMSSAAGSAAYRRSGAVADWLNNTPAYGSPHSGNPTSTHVLTLEHSGYAGTLSGRYNGANGGSLTPYNYSAETKALALFSRSNAAFNLGLDGRFYGGAFGTGTLSSSDRALLERYVAGLTGVAI